MEKIIILIPTYNPSKALISLVDQLMDYPFQQIIIVNDGSDDASGKFFSKIGSHSRVKVLNHAQNRGKGQAIKTGIAYILKNYKEAKGVLTCGTNANNKNLQRM